MYFLRLAEEFFQENCNNCNLSSPVFYLIVGNLFIKRLLVKPGALEHEILEEHKNNLLKIINHITRRGGGGEEVLELQLK